MFEIRFVGVFGVFYAVRFLVERAIRNENLVFLRICRDVRGFGKLTSERRHRARIVNDEVGVHLFATDRNALNLAVLYDEAFNGRRKPKVHDVLALSTYC